MAKVEILPATREDYEEAMEALYGGEARALPARVIAFVGKYDGRVLGFGGVAFFPGGARMAFCDVGDEGRKFPVALHRAALMTIAAAKRAGVRKLVVTEKNMHEKTPNWLKHLGFEKVSGSVETIYVRHLG